MNTHRATVNRGEIVSMYAGLFNAAKGFCIEFIETFLHSVGN